MCEKKTVTRNDGEKIQKILSENWNKENIIEVNFDNVLVASVSFLDQAFGKLALQHTKVEIQKKLIFKKMAEYDRALLNDILRSRFSQKGLAENGATITPNRSRKVSIK